MTQLIIIKALEWSEPNEECSCDHIVADSAIGKFSIEWKSWKDYPGYVLYVNGEYIGTLNNLDHLKVVAQSYFEEKIYSAIDINVEEIILMPIDMFPKVV
jgi:hypothetical protein